MSMELEHRSAPLGLHDSNNRSLKRRSTFNSSQKLIELRPKGTPIRPASPTDAKRKAHAQAQKQNRDRMKAALDRIADMLEGAGAGGGVHAGGGGTKAELVEAAVAYIESLQGQIAQLRGQP